MKKEICLWLLCVAVASAVPVPDPASQEDLIEMILNAKPEDNDITQLEREDNIPAINSVIEPQELESQNQSEDDVKAPITSTLSMAQELDIQAEDQEIPDVDQTQETDSVSDIDDESINVEPENVSIPNDGATSNVEEVEAQVSETIPSENVEVVNEDGGVFPNPELQQNFYETIIPIEEEPLVVIDDEGITDTIEENEEMFSDLEIEETDSIFEDKEVSPIYVEDQVYYEPIIDGQLSLPDEQPMNVYVVAKPGDEVINDEQSFSNFDEEIIPIPEDSYEPSVFPVDPIPEEEIYYEPLIVDESPDAYEQEIYDPTVLGEIIIPDNEEISRGSLIEEENPITDEEEYTNESGVLESFMPEEDQMFLIGDREIVPLIVEDTMAVNDQQIVPVDGEQVFENLPPSQGPIAFENEQIIIIEDPELIEDVIAVDMKDSQFEQSVGEVPTMTEIVSEMTREIESEESDEINQSTFDSNTPIDGENYGLIFSETFSEQNSDSVGYPVEDSSEELNEVMQTFDDDDFNENSFIDSEDFAAQVFPAGLTKEDHIHPISDTLENFFISEDEADNEYKIYPQNPYDGYSSETYMNENMYPVEDDSMIIRDEPNFDFIHMLRPDSEELDDFEEPILEIFPIQSQNPENEQIVPIAEYLNDVDGPIIIEQDSYSISENPIRQPILFPKEMPQRHNLPVFPHEWSEENFFEYPNDGHNDNILPLNYPREPSVFHQHSVVSDYENPHLFQQPPYGSPIPIYDYPNSNYNSRPMPFNRFDDVNENPLSYNTPQNSFLMEQHQTLINEQNNDAQLNGQGQVMPQSDESNIFVNEGNVFDDDQTNSKSPNNYQNPDSMEVPSLSKIALQQDFHGPNTFPLNFRASSITPAVEKYFPTIADSRFHSHIANQRYPTEKYISSQINQGPNSNISPSYMRSSANLFLSMLPQGEDLARFPNNEAMNMNVNMFENTSPEVNPFDTNQQQQYDVQIFIPFESSSNFQPFTRPNPYRYPSPQRPNFFDSYRQSSYNFPSYGRPSPYTDTGISPYQNSHSLDNYRNSDAHHPYSYLTQTW